METKENQSQQTCTLLTAESFGKMLGLSKRQIFRLNSDKKIPAPVRIGGAVRWSRQECLDWIAAGAPNSKTWERMKQTRRDHE